MEDSEVQDLSQFQSEVEDQDEEFKSDPAQEEQTTPVSKVIGLIFSVSKCSRKLKTMRVTKRLSQDSSVFMAAVLQYLSKEILSTAGYLSKLKNKRLISPSHIQKTLKEDCELNDLAADIQLSGSGTPLLFRFLSKEDKQLFQPEK